MEFDLPDPGRMLDQARAAPPLRLCVGQQLAHDVELVEAREELIALDLARSSGRGVSTIWA